MVEEEFVLVNVEKSRNEKKKYSVFLESLVKCEALSMVVMIASLLFLMVSDSEEGEAGTVMAMGREVDGSNAVAEDMRGFLRKRSVLGLLSLVLIRRHGGRIDLAEDLEGVGAAVGGVVERLFEVGRDGVSFGQTCVINGFNDGSCFL